MTPTILQRISLPWSKSNNSVTRKICLMIYFRIKAHSRKFCGKLNRNCLQMTSKSSWYTRKEETTPGYFPNKLWLEAEWKQKAHEKEKVVQALDRLNWECYWAYLVKPHSQQMTVKCIINAAEKVVPALIDSVFSAQLKAEVSQSTLLKPMMNACSFKD